MYTSQHFAEPDPEEIGRLVARHGLAALVSASASGFDVTHAPLLFEPGAGRRALVGHMARPNPHWRRLAQDDPVVAIFRGADAYVTPTLYRAAPDVPTWNYSAVHVHGRWSPVTDPPALREILRCTVEAYEAERGSGWRPADIAAELWAALERGVFAFRIEVDRVDAAQKLSQDKCLRDVEAVADGLAGCPLGGDDTAGAMRRVTLAGRRYRPGPA